MCVTCALSKPKPKSAKKKATSGASGKSGGAARKSAPVRCPLPQREIDQLFDVFNLNSVKVLITTQDKQGLGDLINALKTGALIADAIPAWDAWEVFVRTNHQEVNTFLPSFPRVKVEADDAELGDDESCVTIEVAHGTGLPSGDAGAIAEYGYIEEPDAATSPLARGQGFAPWEMGIFIDPTLMKQKRLNPRLLKTRTLGAALARLEEHHDTAPRLFFGYGAAAKDSGASCLNMMMDRILFDDTIESAVVVLAGYASAETYLTEGRLKALHGEAALELGERPGPHATPAVYTFKSESRRVDLVLPNCRILYTDMRLLWQAADRTFTVCEGDQSLSEAISAGIPFAYQLWHPKGGVRPHKQPLMRNFATLCGGLQAPQVPALIDMCAKYMAYKDPKLDLLEKIIDLTNEEQFKRKFVRLCREIRNDLDVALSLTGYVKRVYIAKRAADVPECQALMSDLDEALSRRACTTHELVTIFSRHKSAIELAI